MWRCLSADRNFTNRVLLASMVNVNGPLPRLIISGSPELPLKLQLMVIPKLWV